MSSLSALAPPQVLPCGHIFHYRCLRAWLEQSHTCPTCRAPLLGTTRTPRVSAAVAAAAAAAAGGGPAAAGEHAAAAGGSADDAAPPGILDVGWGTAAARVHALAAGAEDVEWEGEEEEYEGEEEEEGEGEGEEEEEGEGDGDGEEEGHSAVHIPPATPMHLGGRADDAQRGSRACGCRQGDVGACGCSPVGEV